METFVIGDIHGCFFTLVKLLENWRSEEESLVFCGDLIDRGPHSAAVVEHIRGLQAQFPHVHVLMGNHEQMAAEYLEKGNASIWVYSGGRESLASYSSRNEALNDDLIWMKNLPGYVETDHFLISHAGICDHPDAFDPFSYDGYIWNKRQLAHLGKVQFHGHKPHKNQGPLYTDISNSWNLDAACFSGNGLCGVHIDEKGVVLEASFIHTLDSDKA